MVQEKDCSDEVDVHPTLYRAAQDGHKQKKLTHEEIQALHQGIHEPPKPSPQDADLYPALYKIIQNPVVPAASENTE